jgi:hypothetical protein
MRALIISILKRTMATTTSGATTSSRPKITVCDALSDNALAYAKNM